MVREDDSMSLKQHVRLPGWLRNKTKISDLHPMRRMLKSHGLSTVCEEARCPNRAECYSRPTATFLILGDRCTRSCSFCNVLPAHAPSMPGPDEPERVARAALDMRLEYVVITSVTRDDLPDGGAAHFARTIGALRSAIDGVKVEVLVPDFKGGRDAIDTVLKARPDVFNHNIETVPSLYRLVRPQADYRRSLGVLEHASLSGGDIITKSGLMLGFGESHDEVLSALVELRERGVDFLTMGQYMRPGRRNIAVREYIKPEIFDKLKDTAFKMGFRHVASAPMVRSSMHADEMFNYSIGD